jgi:hypothetical protein
MVLIPLGVICHSHFACTMQLRQALPKTAFLIFLPFLHSPAAAARLLRLWLFGRSILLLLANQPLVEFYVVRPACAGLRCRRILFGGDTPTGPVSPQRKAGGGGTGSIAGKTQLRHWWTNDKRGDDQQQ